MACLFERVYSSYLNMLLNINVFAINVLGLKFQVVPLYSMFWWI
jgi:cytochrome c oxidase assembly protein Cox11